MKALKPRLRDLRVPTFLEGIKGGHEGEGNGYKCRAQMWSPARDQSGHRGPVMPQHQELSAFLGTLRSPEEALLGRAEGLMAGSGPWEGAQSACHSHPCSGDLPGGSPEAEIGSRPSPQHVSEEDGVLKAPWWDWLGKWAWVGWGGQPQGCNKGAGTRTGATASAP